MTTLNSRIASLATAIGTDIKGLTNTIGLLSSLTTINTGTIVAAINEIKESVDTERTARIGTDTSLRSDITNIQNQLSGGIATINDITTSTSTVFSSYKVVTLLADLRTEVFGGIPTSTLDTIKELADFLSDNTIANGLIDQLAKRVRVDSVQSFTNEQKLQARENIGAASESSFTNLISALGTIDYDYVADYNTAKA